MVIQDLFSKLVFLDTAPLVYYMEGKSEYQEILNSLFEHHDNGSLFFATSTITLLEVLVKPIREGKIQLAEQYRNILTQATGIALLPVTVNISEKAARLRAVYGLKTPDAIQLAAALEVGCEYFLTNDLKLKVVSEVPVITLSDILNNTSDPETMST